MVIFVFDIYSIQRAVLVNTHTNVNVWVMQNYIRKSAAWFLEDLTTTYFPKYHS